MVRRIWICMFQAQKPIGSLGESGSTCACTQRRKWQKRAEALVHGRSCLYLIARALFVERFCRPHCRYWQLFQREPASRGPIILTVFVIRSWLIKACIRLLLLCRHLNPAISASSWDLVSQLCSTVCSCWSSGGSSRGFRPSRSSSRSPFRSPASETLRTGMTSPMT